MNENGRDSKIEKFIVPAKEEFTKFIYEFVDEIKEGFKDEEAGVMQWIKNNLSRINLEGVPDNMKMMANMKTGMMCG